MAGVPEFHAPALRPSILGTAGAVFSSGYKLNPRAYKLAHGFKLLMFIELLYS